VTNAHADRGQMTTLTIAEGDLPRVSLPMLVSGGGPAWAGSAVVIDGLPTGARLSHGIRIAPDSWTVGIADVADAVLSLPPTTPDRLELSVRVLAANSLELAASGLQINVLRSRGKAEPIAPAALFEPAAAETEKGPEPDLGLSPPPRTAAKLDRSKRAPSSAKQPEWPTATSAWIAEQRAPAPLPGFAPMPSWAPFNDR